MDSDFTELAKDRGATRFLIPVKFMVKGHDPAFLKKCETNPAMLNQRIKYPDDPKEFREAYDRMMKYARQQTSEASQAVILKEDASPSLLSSCQSDS